MRRRMCRARLAEPASAAMRSVASLLPPQVGETGLAYARRGGSILAWNAMAALLELAGQPEPSLYLISGLAPPPPPLPPPPPAYDLADGSSDGGARVEPVALVAIHLRRHPATTGLSSRGPRGPGHRGAGRPAGRQREGASGASPPAPPLPPPARRAGGSTCPSLQGAEEVF